MLAVFLPPTPNPTSGFLLFVPREDVRVLDMSIEAALKLVISSGLVSPEDEPAGPLSPRQASRLVAERLRERERPEPVE